MVPSCEGDLIPQDCSKSLIDAYSEYCVCYRPIREIKGNRPDLEWIRGQAFVFESSRFAITLIVEKCRPRIRGQAFAFESSRFAITLIVEKCRPR